MSDNFAFSELLSRALTLGSKDLSGIHMLKVIMANEAGTDMGAILEDILTELQLNTPVSVGGITAVPSSSFSRPADTTAYASGDLVANSTTAGSVTPMSWTSSRVTGAGGMVRRARLRKSGTGITNAAFRLHLFTATVTAANGDNAAWSVSGSATYLGYFDITVDKAFTDGAGGIGSPANGNDVNYAADTLYGVLEARGAYTPASGETFAVTLELIQN